MPPKTLNFNDFRLYLRDFAIEQGRDICDQILFDDLISITMLKANEWRFRAVYRFETGRGDYFLKLNETLRFKDSIRMRILIWRKWAEWRNLVRLTRLGFNVAKPCLRGIRKGKGPLAYFIVTGGIAGKPLDYADLDDAAAMGSFVAGLHTGKVYMADLQPGNLLREPDGKIGFFDVQRLWFMPVITRYWRLRNMGYFFFIATYHNQISKEWRQAFLTAYNAASGRDFMLTALDQALSGVARRFGAKHDKRSHMRKGEFLHAKDKGWQGFVRTDSCFNWQQMPGLLNTAAVLKEDRVFLANDVVIKRFPLRFLHADRCFNAFKMAFELQKRGINTPQNIAYLKKGRYSYYISAYLPNAVTVNEYFSAMQGCSTHNRRQIRKFAQWVGFVHSQDVFQHDFKSCNVLCADNEFYMVDLEGVRLRTPAFNDKVYNLAQLNASMSKYVTLRDRLRFFAVYAREQKLPPAERRVVLQKIWDVMLKKNTAYYDLAPEDIWPVKPWRTIK